MIPKYRDGLNFIFGSMAGLFGTVLLYPSHMLKRVLQANSMLINYCYIVILL